MLLYCSAELLLKALDESDIDDPAVQRAANGLRRVLDLTAKRLDPNVTSTTTPLGPSDLATARDFVREGIADGVDCPCCGQSCKLYPRKLYAEMGAWLILLVQRHAVSDDWVNVKDFPLRGGDYGKLIHWKLVERAPNDSPAKRTSGLWRPTPAGIDFAHGRTRVPSHVYLYDNEVHRFGDQRVDIRDVLGEEFNYAELMAGLG